MSAALDQLSHIEAIAAELLNSVPPNPEDYPVVASILKKYVDERLPKMKNAGRRGRDQGYRDLGLALCSEPKPAKRASAIVTNPRRKENATIGVVTKYYTDRWPYEKDKTVCPHPPKSVKGLCWLVLKLNPPTHQPLTWEYLQHDILRE